jgi:hypothetical protein
MVLAEGDPQATQGPFGSKVIEDSDVDSFTTVSPGRDDTS